MICNSADLADIQKVPPASDASLLAEFANRDKLRIIEQLADGPAKPKDLLEALDLAASKSGSMSHWLSDLARAGLILQEPGSNTWSPYSLVAPKETDDLIDAAAVLAAAVSEARVQAAMAQAEADAGRLDARTRRGREKRSSPRAT